MNAQTTTTKKEKWKWPKYISKVNQWKNDFVTVNAIAATPAPPTMCSSQVKARGFTTSTLRAKAAGIEGLM
jgi:hypothetical protein